MADSNLQKLQNDVNTIKNSYAYLLQHQNDLWNLLIFALIALFFTFLIIGFTAYIRGRNSERGKIDARLKVLDSLVQEQSKIVEAVEIIKRNIEKGIWLEKERNTIKRQKIAEMMTNLSKINPYLFKQLNQLITDEGNLDYENNPISTILDIGNLYFEPNEIEGLTILNSLHTEIAEINVNYFTKKIHYLKETGTKMAISDDIVSSYSTTINKYIEPIAQLRLNLGKVMSTLLNDKNSK